MIAIRVAIATVWRLVAIFVASALLNACGSVVSTSRNSEANWRLGTVVRVADSVATGITRVDACGLPAGHAEAGVVVVMYRAPVGYRNRVALRPQESSAAVGDRLYVNATRCDVPMRRAPVGR